MSGVRERAAMTASTGTEESSGHENTERRLLCSHSAVKRHWLTCELDLTFSQSKERVILPDTDLTGTKSCSQLGQLCTHAEVQ